MSVTHLHNLRPLHLTQDQRRDRLSTDGLIRAVLNPLLLNMTGSHPSRMGAPGGKEKDLAGRAQQGARP